MYNLELLTFSSLPRLDLWGLHGPDPSLPGNLHFQDAQDQALKVCA